MKGSRKTELQLGGMAEAVITPAGTAELVSNLYRDPEGTWVVMPGSMPASDSTPGSGAISSITWFNPRPNQRWLVIERVLSATRSQIRWVDLQTLSTQLVTARRRVSNADPGSIFAENARWLHIFSPIDAPVRWNGLWTSPVGFTQSAPAPVAQGPDQGFDFVDKAFGDFTGPIFRSPTRQRGVGPYPSDDDEPWRYGYALTMLNELGQESPPSGLVYVSGTNRAEDDGGRQLVYIGVPQLPDHIRGARLYRTKNIVDATVDAAAFTLYLVREFPSAAPTDYLDNVPDEELLLELDRDQLGTIPVGARAAAFWGGTLWLGGAPDDPTRVRYSAPNFPEQFPGVNYLPVGSSKTGAIIALFPIQRGLGVFKTGGVYVIKGDHRSGFHVETVSEQVGAATGRAIEYVQGLGLVFLAASGPQVLVGNLGDDKPSAVVPLKGIRKLWRERVGRNLATSIVVHQPEYNEIWFQVPEGGDTRPTLGLVYHIDLQQWSIREGWSVSCFTRAFGRTWVGSWDDTESPGVHLLTFASTTRLDGEDVVGVYQPGFLQFPESMSVIGVELWGRAYGPSATLQIETRADRRPAVAATSTAGKAQVLNTTDATEVWGTGFWDDTKTWTDYHPDRFRTNLRMLKTRELGLSVTGDKMALFAARVEFAGTDSKVEPEGRP